MQTYTLGLALEDYVPVILSLLGLWFIVQMIGRLERTNGRLALAGLLLIGLGGLFKATWKLNMATTGQDIVWMDNSLFPFLGPGFTLMVFALYDSQQILQGAGKTDRLWIRPIAVILLFGLGAILAARGGGRTWVFVLLGLTTLANSALLVLLILQARRQHQRLVTILFMINLVLIFVLSGLARIEPQTIPLQWVDQIINTISQLAFVFAAWLLVRDTATIKA